MLNIFMSYLVFYPGNQQLSVASMSFQSEWKTAELGGHTVYKKMSNLGLAGQGLSVHKNELIKLLIIH